MPDIEKDQQSRTWEKPEIEKREVSPETSPSPEKKEEPEPEKESRSPQEQEKSEAETRERPTEEPEQSPEQQEVSVKDVEQVLQAGLETIYKDLPDDKKREFRSKGEDTAQRIFKLLDGSVPKPKKITKLIKSWLSAAPELSDSDIVVEQKAKNKTDKLLHLTNKEEYGE